VISPFKTLVPVPAMKVPIVEATSRPALPEPPTVRVYVFVEPEVTEVGPVSVTVGLAPVLWQLVQVEPVFPEKPEMPLLLAFADCGR